MMIAKLKRGPVIRKRSDHRLSRKKIDPDALKVLYRLSRSGFTAYLVGGGVRDLLLGKQPKDFDVSTDAHPNEIRRLFNNCFLIGRRFRLAHIRFGRNIIETSTFRRQPEEDQAVDIDMRGALVQHHDNTFGTPEEDANRRDFTVNGLFYNIADFSIIDYVGGLADLEKGLIRSIGDPNIRFREDPVRMLRAIRFSSRLNFKIHRESLKALKKHAPEILHCAPARIFEEIGKLFTYRSAEPAMRALWQHGLIKHLIPEIHRYINRSGKKNSPVFDYLAALDSQKSFLGNGGNAIRFGSLIYALFEERLEKERKKDEHVHQLDLAREILKPMLQKIKMPRKQMYQIIHMLDAQRRFTSKSKRFRKSKFVKQESFADALDLQRVIMTTRDENTQKLQPWIDLYRQEMRNHPKKSSDDKKRRSSNRRGTGRKPRRRNRPRKPNDRSGHNTPKQRN